MNCNYTMSIKSSQQHVLVILDGAAAAVPPGAPPRRWKRTESRLKFAEEEPETEIKLPISLYYAMEDDGE